MRRQLVHRLRLFGWAVASVPLAALSLVLFVLTTVGTALVVVTAGIPLVAVALRLTRPLADLHRRVAGGLLGRPVESPYLTPPVGSWVALARARALDPATRRDLLWLLVNGTFGLAISIGAVVETAFELVFWWLPKGLLVRLHAWICASLLATSEKSRLALRVQELASSRAETVDTQAAELRRIERDLHDGAQARLVSLGLSLAMADDLIERDPQAARALLAEARSTSSAALTDLRDLVRGIHPPVLADRGLAGGVEALALASPVPVELELDLPTRLPAPVESAAYVALAETLTNVIKHADASRVAVHVGHRDDRLEALVVDDGVGGADPAPGSGLRGIERRLAAFDGTLTLSSPAGGPTEVVIVLPCVSSSPKISPSSGTA
ncbi:MAG: sensor histidine kinase [Jatrophihabitans sp.]|uniref:sensor histidine kinase n=1 Tax=Jatrophihabitans sp. TaxID=1932789 RepID=UPI003F8174F2